MQSLIAALAQINVTVGALAANAAKIVRVACDAQNRGASLILFPELALSGYPPEDLVLKPHFMADVAQQLQSLAIELPTNALVVVGTPWSNQGKIYNAAAIFSGGHLLGLYHKMQLPNYGVFDEKRVFQAGKKSLVIEFNDLKLGLHICEDSWVISEAPCSTFHGGVVDAVLNISASPYHRNKHQLRERILGRAANAMQAPLLYCNLVGGQDELVFDGYSMALAADGQVIARAHPFEEDLLFVHLPVAGVGRSSAIGSIPDFKGVDSIKVSNDWKLPEKSFQRLENTNRIEPLQDDMAEVYQALKLGLQDYVNKNGFRGVIVAISGGIDSALVATLAVDALGHDRVTGITMPSRFSSSETLGDAEALARNLNIQFYTKPIEHLHKAFLDELTPLWPDRKADSTEENIQARIRGNIVMALSNKFGWLVLTTGNKSELATGYCTLYGDMAGGFAVIKDVPKTLVFELARWRNQQFGVRELAPAIGLRSLLRGGEPQDTAESGGKPHALQSQRTGAAPAHEGREPIPATTIDRPPSAELRENQKDCDSLPPYDVLDSILERYVERDLSADQIVSEGFDQATVKRVIRLVDGNEYKRRQGAPGVKITPKSFGRDRRLPITNLYGERVEKNRP